MEPNIISQPIPPITPETQTPAMQPVQPTPSASSGKTKYIMFGLFILLIIAAVGGGMYYLGVAKQQSVSQKSNNPITVTVMPSPTPTPIYTIQPTSTPNQTGNSPQPLVGGDKDENGCIGSAGYSWCTAKQKCLRVFEEDCLSIEGIKTALANKYNKSLDKVFIIISHENSQYAVGSVKFDQIEGPGGVFMATKISGKWEIVYDGNGSIDCNKIKQTYEFTKEMLIGLCD